MKIKLIIFLLFILSFHSCKKDKQYTTYCAGRVISASSQPIEGVTILMVDSDPEYGISANNISKTTLTDKNGNFSLSITGNANTVTLIPSKSGYLEYQNPKYTSQNVNYMVFNSGANYSNLSIELDASAYFNPYLMSTVPNTYNDTLIVNVISYSYPETSDYGALYFYGKGPFELSTVDLYAIGDRYRKFKLQFTRNQQWVTKRDSVYIKAFTTYRDTIYY